MVVLETVNNQYLGKRCVHSLFLGDGGGGRPAGGGSGEGAAPEDGEDIFIENREKQEELLRYLYEKEIITGEEFMRILKA